LGLVMSSSIEEEEKEEAKKGYTCPICKENVEYFTSTPRNPFVYCPKCGARIRRTQVPKEAVLIRPKKAGVPAISLHRKEEEKGISLFGRIKTPHEILEEILRFYQLPEEFIKIAVRRSQLVGGLHPTTLRQMLESMKISGVKDKETASFIAEEYYYALLREQQKARERGEEVRYPIGIGGVESRRPSYYPGLDYTYRQSYISQRPRLLSYPYGGGYPPSEKPLTREEVMQMLEQIFQRRQQEERIEKLREELKELQKNTDEKITKVISEMKDMISQVLAIAQKKPEDVVTTKQLLDILEKRDKDRYIEYLKDRSKLLEQQLGNTLKTMEEQRKTLEKKIEALSSQLRVQPSADYKSDEMRLAAQGLQTLASVIEKKNPVRIVIEGLPMILGQPGQKKSELKGKGEATVEKYLPEQYIEGG